MQQQPFKQVCFYVPFLNKHRVISIIFIHLSLHTSFCL
jgi:hypothetical protein